MKVLFIAVHPDDETLGCGGTILKHKKNGDEIFWLIITGVSKELGFSDEFIEKRKNQISEVNQAYGFNETIEFNFPTTKLHTIDFSDLLEKISAVIKRIQPKTVYTINRSDIHTDHQCASKAVISSLKSFRYPFVKKILMYECISETEMAMPLPENIFIPNSYSDITDFMDKKIEIMEIYNTEIQETPLPRSIENIKALARFRGATMCLNYAESFMVLRDIF